MDPIVVLKNEKKPVMLRSILAICCLVEIISAMPMASPRPSSLKSLIIALNTTCKQIEETEHKECGEEWVANLKDNFQVNPNARDTREMCEKYPMIFRNVSCALMNLNRTKCENTSMKDIKYHVSSLKGTYNVTCSTQESRIPLKSFCRHFEGYVQRLSDRICNNTSKNH